MDLSLSDVGGKFWLSVNSPCMAMLAAAVGEFHSRATAQSEPLYEVFVERRALLAVATGQFGAMMAVSLVNDGPVTLLLEKDCSSDS